MPDIVTGKIFIDGETNITAAKLNSIISTSVIQTDFVAAKPVASATAAGDNLLLLKSDSTYAKIDSSVFASAISALLPAPEQKIWSVRLNSFQALGNSSFEVDQRSSGALLANPATGTLVLDRWQKQSAGTAVVSVKQTDATLPDVVVPGTNFRITSKFLRVTLTTVQASLGVNDQISFTQLVEGPRFRELQNDVHSVSVLVRCSVAGTKFGLTLRDPATATRSLSKLCTIAAANTWTLIQLPNLPVWPTAGAFVTTPGSNAYQFTICLAAGTTLTSPAADTWQNGNFVGVPGQDNFANKALSSTFDIAFAQHEPGSQCSTPMDCPFTQNYDDALRYFQKSYDLGVAAGTVTAAGVRAFIAYGAVAAANGPLSFHKPMAKIPAVILYDHNNGAANSVMDNAGVHHGSAGPSTVGTTGFYGISFATATSASMPVYCHYTADTGW